MRRFVHLAFALFVLLPWTAPAPAAQLDLPPGMVALASPQGQQMLFEAGARTAYWPLSAVYVTQDNQAYCGVASMVMVLNSLPIAAPSPKQYAPYAFFTQDDLFPADGTTYLQGDWIAHHGLTLDQLGSVAAHFGITVDIVHATADGLARFRHDAAAALAAPDHYVLVNFSRKALAEEGYGHISPLAAYDAKTDRFLILDVARYKYPPAWVSTEALYAAIDTVDAGAGKTRGYLVLSLPK